MKKITFIVVMLISVMLFANNGGGSTVLPFLNLNLAARPSGMADCFIGLADDLNSISINPAGLGFWGRSAVSFSHMTYIADIQLMHIAATYKLENIGTFGLIWQNINYGEIMGTDDEGADTEVFTPSDVIMGISFGRDVNEVLSAGLTVKYLYSKLTGEFQTESFAFDFGLLFKFKFGNNDMGAGFTLKNVGPNITYDHEREPLPMLIGAGIFYELLAFENSRLLLLSDVSKTPDSDIKYAFGLEWKFMKLISLRAGYKPYADATEMFTAGVGIGYSINPKMRFELDYSFGYSSENFVSDTHKFTIGCSF